LLVHDEVSGGVAADPVSAAWIQGAVRSPDTDQESRSDNGGSFSLGRHPSTLRGLYRQTGTPLFVWIPPRRVFGLPAPESLA
jgi:hypothetical protein